MLVWHTYCQHIYANFYNMTHKEFIEKTGLDIPSQDFSKVYDMYIYAGDKMDKASFFEDFKQHHQSKLLQVFYSRLAQLESKIDALKDEQYNTAIYLITSGKSKKDHDMAVKMIGQKSITLYKLENNIELNNEDITYLKTTLDGSKLIKNML